jgi:ribose transport system ATP-binding protein
VSHRLDEILALCDNVTVFKDGREVLQTSRAELSKDSLVESIVGAALHPRAALPGRRDTGEVVLEARNLSRGRRVRDVSLELRRGEVLGLAGLVGAGRTELARLLFGADPLDAGEILLDGEPIPSTSPATPSVSASAWCPRSGARRGSCSTGR